MKTIIRFLLALLILPSSGLLFAQNAKVHGTVLDDGDPMPLQNIVLQSNGSIIRRGMTNEQGKFEFALLDAGTYTIEVTDGDLFYRFNINLAPNETEPCRLDLNKALVFNSEGERVYMVENGTIYAPADGGIHEIFTVDPVSIDIVTVDQLNEIPGRGLDAALAMSGPGFYQADQGSPLNISGARDYGTAVYVDGVKVRGDFDVSQACINQVAFMNNGIPAAFGDLTGGVVLITTYNPGMKGSAGKPVSAAQRKADRKLMKRGKSGGQVQSEQFPV